MRYRVTIKGLSPLIVHNGAAGLDTKSPANIEIAEINRKKDSNKTSADIERQRFLECQTSLYLDASGAPTIPASAIRACIETGARKLKQGPQVREGLVVESLDFHYDADALGKTAEDLGRNAQFTVPAVVGRGRVMRTRAKFDKWSCTVDLDCDDELIDQDQLEAWLDIAGRRIGLCDWRPEKSGSYGRFKATVTPIA